MICLYLEDSFDENIKTALTERMTRYPICNEDKDISSAFCILKICCAPLTTAKSPT